MLWCLRLKAMWMWETGPQQHSSSSVFNKGYKGFFHIFFFCFTQNPLAIIVAEKLVMSYLTKVFSSKSSPYKGYEVSYIYVCDGRKGFFVTFLPITLNVNGIYDLFWRCGDHKMTIFDEVLSHYSRLFFYILLLKCITSLTNLITQIAEKINIDPLPALWSAAKTNRFLFHMVFFFSNRDWYE